MTYLNNSELVDNRWLMSKGTPIGPRWLVWCVRLCGLRPVRWVALSTVRGWCVCVCACVFGPCPGPGLGNSFQGWARNSPHERVGVVEAGNPVRRRSRCRVCDAVNILSVLCEAASVTSTHRSPRSRYTPRCSCRALATRCPNHDGRSARSRRCSQMAGFGHCRLRVAP